MANPPLRLRVAEVCAFPLAGIAVTLGESAPKSVVVTYIGFRLAPMRRAAWRATLMRWHFAA